MKAEIAVLILLPVARTTLMFGPLLARARLCLYRYCRACIGDHGDRCLHRGLTGYRSIGQPLNLGQVRPHGGITCP